MLKGNSDPVNLEQVRDEIIAKSESGLNDIEQNLAQVSDSATLSPKGGRD